METHPGNSSGFLESNALRENAKRFYRAVLQSVWTRIWTDACVDLAAQMSFYFVLSIFPLLLVLASIIGWLPSTNLWHNFAQWISHYLPPYARGASFHAILGLTHGYSSFFSVGLVAMIWSASSGFVSLIQSLNIAYKVKETRGFWKERLIALIAAALASVFLLGSFGLLTAGKLAVTLVAKDMPWVQHFRIWFAVGRWLASLALLLIGVDLINHFLPNRKRRWRWFTAGTIFVVASFVATAFAFDVYVTDFANYSKVYGALAGAIILLLWVYAFSLILLLGAEIDHAIELVRGEQPPA
ncbi:MAG TPA: YihY/virulence factor BrkB family protein [Candidatus Acidoferrum sp.]|nr:YihY/virulence factor BrkB family protein [Candidatus Acidoferrum sp.]